MNRSYTQKQIDDLVEMSNAENRFDLYKIGEEGAKKIRMERHFGKEFKAEAWQVGEWCKSSPILQYFKINLKLYL